jgi:hypothetical protein
LKIRFYKGKNIKEKMGKNWGQIFILDTSRQEAGVGNGRDRSLRAKTEIYRWFNLQD